MSDASLWFTRATVRENAPDVIPLINTIFPKDSASRRLDVTHRLLWTLMTEEVQTVGKLKTPEGGDKAAFLWRNAPEAGRNKCYYVLGPRPRLESAFFDIETKPWAPAFSAGDHLAFDVVVNATVNRMVDAAKGRNGRQRVDVVMDAIHAAERDPQHAPRSMLRNALAEGALVAWWTAQGERNGFRMVQTLTVGDYKTVLIDDRRRTGHRFPQIGVAHLSGTLEITDPAAFATRVANGFGRAKAFGCGLMLLKR